jgi:poly(3-hydroxybutyrate) depolymerase
MCSSISQCNKKRTTVVEPGGVIEPQHPVGRMWHRMMYLAYQAQNDLMEPMRAAARMTRRAIGWALPGLPALRGVDAFCELLDRATLTHERPAYGITRTPFEGREVAVVEESALALPFATLLHFRKDVEAPQPRVLVVAPLSGHFATLLRHTVETLLPEHDVYITDWRNARDVPLADGRFGFDEYVDYLIRFLEEMGPGAHLLAVCQPCVQAMVAAAVMAQDGNPAAPRSMTLMAGPVDARINPTKVNELANGQTIEWFEEHLIATVPARHAGAGRRVYPGFLQLSAFMSMNAERHQKAHRELYAALARGDEAAAAATKAFYDEYFAVLDLDADFYLETVQWVFQEHRLAAGTLTWHGQKIDRDAVRKTSLLTVEGERDDICALGQTAAAHDLLTGIKPFRKRHHMQAGVGHYGVFSGRRWASQVYPIVRNLILASN